MEQTISNTRQELLENTINYFNSKNRAVDGDGACNYYMIDGRRCAIGKELTEELARELDGNYADSGVIEYEIFERLPKRLKDMGEVFLSKIQHLHDTSIFWNKTGLTNEGKEHVRIIKQEYNLN